MLELPAGTFAVPPVPKCANRCEETPQLDADAAVAVRAFLAVFANRQSLDAQKGHIVPWAATLREMRARGFTDEEIWQACVVAHTDNRHAPFHALNAIWPNLRTHRKTHSAAPVDEPNSSDLLPVVFDGPWNEEAKAANEHYEQLRAAMREKRREP